MGHQIYINLSNKRNETVIRKSQKASDAEVEKLQISIVSI
jgi:hypothetical protein